MKYMLILWFSILIPGSLCYGKTSDDLIIMTEQFPPYNFAENGELKGSAVDLMVLIFDKIDSKQTVHDINILPWGRAYKDLLEKENTMLFVMTRTAKREKLFKWAGPISTSRNVLIAKKSRNIKINSLADIKNFTVGAVRNDAGEQLVITKTGVNKNDMQIAANAAQSIRMLSKNRIDLFAYDENVVKWLLKKEGLNMADYETVLVLEEGLHYFAFNRDTADEIVEQIQSVLDEIKAQGNYERFLNRYLN